MSIPNIYVLLYHPKIEGKKTSEGSYCLSPHLPYCCTIPKQKQTHLRGLSIPSIPTFAILLYRTSQNRNKYINKRAILGTVCLCVLIFCSPPPFFFSRMAVWSTLIQLLFILCVFHTDWLWQCEPIARYFTAYNMFSSMTHSTCGADLNFYRHCFVTLKNVLNDSKAYAIPLSRLQL